MMEDIRESFKHIAIQDDLDSLITRVATLQSLTINSLKLHDITDVLKGFRERVDSVHSRFNEAEAQLTKLAPEQNTIDSVISDMFNAEVNAFKNRIDSEIEHRLEEKIEKRFREMLASRTRNGRAEFAPDDQFATSLTSLEDASRQSQRDIDGLKKIILSLQTPPGPSRGVIANPSSASVTSIPGPTSEARRVDTPEAPRSATALLDLSAEGFLKWLRCANLRKAENILRLQSMKFEPGYVRLFRYQTDDGQNIYKYIVHIDRDNGTHLGSKYLVSPVFRPRQAIESVLLEMTTSFDGSKTRRRSPERNRIKAPRMAKFPEYVYELGEILFRSRDANESKWSDLRETHCHLIIDVADPNKSLWIVYRWKGYEDGEQLYRRAKFDRDLDCFKWMDASKSTFDIAQVGKKFGDWIMDDGKVKDIPYFEGLMKQTWARDAFPAFSLPTFRGLKESLGLDDMA